MLLPWTFETKTSLDPHTMQCTSRGYWNVRIMTKSHPCEGEECPRMWPMVEVHCMTLYGHVPYPIAPIHMTHHLKMVPLLSFHNSGNQWNNGHYHHHVVYRYVYWEVIITMHTYVAKLGEDYNCHWWLWGRMIDADFKGITKKNHPPHLISNSLA